MGKDVFSIKTQRAGCEQSNVRMSKRSNVAKDTVSYYHLDGMMFTHHVVAQQRYEEQLVLH